MFKEMCDKRNSIVQEIYHTEKNYVNNLKNVERIFMKPLIENSESDDPFISKADARTIFSELNVIIGLNEVFLKELKSLVEKNWSSTSLISPLFLKIFPYLRWYHSYISNYDKSYNTIKNLKATNPKFKQFIQQCESKPELNFMDLESLLIQPVQRIPQYNLLINDLFKSTHEEHPDYLMTKEALTTILELGNYVNEKKRESENIQKVVEIGNRLKGFSNLAMPYRRILLEEDFEVLTDGASEVQKVKAFLFNDLLLITQKQEDGFQVIESSYFDRISILNENALSKAPVMTIKIKDKKCNFMCSSLNIKKNWIENIKKLSDRYSITIDRKREHFLKLCEINNILNKLNNQNEPLTTLSLGILNLNIKSAQKLSAGKQEEPNEVELKSAFDEDKARFKRIKEAVEKDVLNQISKEGFSSIDEYLKAIGYEAHIVIPFEILNDKNTLISRPAFLLLNKSFVIIVEKGKAVLVYHLLDILSLTSQVYPDFTIKFKDNNEILGRSEYCDDIIFVVRKTYLHSFPGIPENRTWKVNVGGITPKIVPPLNLECGGFKRTFRSVCDWIDHKLRNDIIWDVTHFQKSNLGGIFDLSKIEDLTTTDLKAITISLRYNQYFKEFICNNINLSKDFVLLIADMFKYNNNFKKISFNYNNLSKDTMSILLESLSQDSHDFEEIEISNNIIEDKNISYFVAYFDAKKMMSLKKLDISNTSVGPKGISQLFAQIKKNVSLYHSLQCINISGNRLDTEGSRTLSSYLATPCAITHLNVSNTQSKLSNIFEALMRGCKYLQYINVSQNKITKNMLSSIVNFIKGSDSLLHFDISATSISGESIGKIIEAVSENPYIKRLTLIANENNYEYVDAVEISKAFQNMRGIESLSINDNELSDEGISVIARSLKNASNGLKKLSIDGNFKLKSNKTRKSMIKNLCSLLTSNLSTLTHLSMAGGNKSASLKQDIIPLLNSLSRSNLKEINISGHKMGNTGAFALARSFQSNMPLEVLTFDENAIGIEGFTALIESLKTCKNILTVHLPIVDMGIITSQNDEKINKKISTLLNELNQHLFQNNLKVHLKSLSGKKPKASESKPKLLEQKQSKKSKNTQTSGDNTNIKNKSGVKKKLKTPRSSRSSEEVQNKNTKKKSSTTESSSSSGSHKIDESDQSSDYSTTENRIRRNSIVARKFTRTQSRNTTDVLDLATKKIDEKDETYGDLYLNKDSNLDIEILEDDEEDVITNTPGYTNEDSDSENEEEILHDNSDAESDFEVENPQEHDINEADETLSISEKELLDIDEQFDEGVEKENDLYGEDSTEELRDDYEDTENFINESYKNEVQGDEEDTESSVNETLKNEEVQDNEEDTEISINETVINEEEQDKEEDTENSINDAFKKEDQDKDEDAEISIDEGFKNEEVQDNDKGTDCSINESFKKEVQDNEEDTENSINESFNNEESQDNEEDSESPINEPFNNNEVHDDDVIEPDNVIGGPKSEESIEDVLHDKFEENNMAYEDNEQDNIENNDISEINESIAEDTEMTEKLSSSEDDSINIEVESLEDEYMNLPDKEIKESKSELDTDTDSQSLLRYLSVDDINNEDLKDMLDRASSVDLDSDNNSNEEIIDDD